MSTEPETKKTETTEQKTSVFTKETLGVVIVLFATLCLVCLITREKVFFTPGQYVNAFLLGTFGYFAYGVIAYAIILGVELITDKRIPLSVKNIVLITVFFVCASILAHIISMSSFSGDYGGYLATAYNMGAGGISTSSAGGIIIALVAYPIMSLLTVTGACVVVGLCTAGLGTFIVINFVKEKNTPNVKPPKFRSTAVETEQKPSPIVIEGEKDYPISIPIEEAKPIKPSQKLFINNENDFGFKTKKEMAKGESVKIEFSENGLGVSTAQNSYADGYSEDMKRKLEYIKTPTTFDVEGKSQNLYYGTTVSEPIAKPAEATPTVSTPPSTPVVSEKPKEIPMYEHEQNVSETEQRAQNFSTKYAGTTEPKPINPEQTEVFRPYVAEEEQVTELDYSEALDELEKLDSKKEEVLETPVIPVIEEELPAPTNIPLRERRRNTFIEEEKTEETNTKPVISEEPVAFTSRVEKDGNDELLPRRRQPLPISEETPKEEPKEEKKPVPINRVYNKPPLDLLERHDLSVDSSTENHEERMSIIKQTLDEFHINAEPKDFIQGPTITRYEIMMPPGISVKKVLSYDDDLKMRLSSKEGVRIQAPIPGKNAVGIEVANKCKMTVGLRELLEQTADVKLGAGKLIFALGKDIVGKAITDNLAKGPHYLVAGATGSGKSVCLNVMIISMLMRYSPEELRLILVDPKSVGFRMYEHIPHLMIDEIITDPKRALSALSWAQVEMERRYKVFAECPELIMDIEAYNTRIAGPTVAKMPRLVIIIDELADLMETCKKDMEAKIRAIAQKARAAGIHLVLATQRPSVDIITGTIKANLPSRIALKVMNFNDSQTILSEAGAEKLLGNGDMLYKNSSMAECERYQGAWISDREITNVVNYIKENNESYFDEDLKNFLDKSNSQSAGGESSFEGDEEGDGEVSDLFKKALWLAVTTGQIAISQLQRRFQIGYARAGGLVDKMFQMGFVSDNEGSKARKVLITREQFEERFGPMDDSY